MSTDAPLNNVKPKKSPNSMTETLSEWQVLLGGKTVEEYLKEREAKEARTILLAERVRQLEQAARKAENSMKKNVKGKSSAATSSAESQLALLGDAAMELPSTTTKLLQAYDYDKPHAISPIWPGGGGTVICFANGPESQEFGMFILKKRGKMFSSQLTPSTIRR